MNFSKYMLDYGNLTRKLSVMSQMHNLKINNHINNHINAHAKLF